MTRRHGHEGRVNDAAQWVDLLTVVGDRLTPAQALYVEGEDEAPEEVWEEVSYLSRVPYPVSPEPAAAIEAAGSHYVLPWWLIQSQYPTAWVLDHYRRGEDPLPLPGEQQKTIPEYPGESGPP